MLLRSKRLKMIEVISKLLKIVKILKVFIYYFHFQFQSIKKLKLSAGSKCPRLFTTLISHLGN